MHRIKVNRVGRLVSYSFSKIKRAFSKYETDYPKGAAEAGLGVTTAHTVDVVVGCQYWVLYGPKTTFMPTSWHGVCGWMEKAATWELNPNIITPTYCMYFYIDWKDAEA